MSRALDLQIKMTSDASDAVDAFEDTGRAARTMGDDVDKASRVTEDASKRIDRASQASDGLADSSSKATGALGALSSGFELVGLEKYSGALQGASMATDFFSGVGDAASLIMEKSTVVTKLHTGALKAQAIAQRALNIVMRANPVLLIVTGVLLLIGVLVTAYKKSETFRKIVDGAFRAIQAAASFAFGWVKDHWPLLLAIITGPIGLAVLAVVKNWDKIKNAAETAFSKIGDFIRNLTAPLQAIVDFIDKIIDKIGAIHIPHVDLNPFNGRTTAGRTTGFAGTGGDVHNYYISGALDPNAVALQIDNLVRGRVRRLGG